MYFTGIIYVTGEDHESTMSNKDDTLYLRARRRGKPVVIRRHPNVSYYSYSIYARYIYMYYCYKL